MPSTVKKDLERKRGDTRADTFYCQKNGAAEDITSGYQFVMTVDQRKAPDDESTKLFHVNGVPSPTVTGQFSFSPSDAQADQSPATYYYDIQMLDPNGERWTIYEGKYKIRQDITKS